MWSRNLFFLILCANCGNYICRPTEASHSGESSSFRSNEAEPVADDRASGNGQSSESSDTEDESTEPGSSEIDASEKTCLIEGCKAYNKVFDSKAYYKRHEK